MIASRIARHFSALFFGVALVIAVGERPAGAQTGDISLTPDIVQNFVASYAAVQAKADELRAEYDVPEGGTATTAWQTWMGVGGAKSELDSTVGAHGFPEFGSWLQAFSAIAKAYAFAKDGGALDGQMAEALEQLRNDPNIPAAQKEMMLQQLQASAGAIAGMRPPQENIDAVTPYLEELAVAFDDRG